jgi:hypothetical protein
MERRSFSISSLRCAISASLLERTARALAASAWATTAFPCTDAAKVSACMRAIPPGSSRGGQQDRTVAIHLDFFTRRRNHIRRQSQSQSLTPTDVGRQVCCGFRQSMPDSRYPSCAFEIVTAPSCGARPQKATMLQLLALAVMPNHLQKIAPAAAKAKQMAAERIAAQHLLHLQGQRWKAPAHIRVTRR